MLPAGPAWGIRKVPVAPGKAGGLPVVSVSAQAGLPGSRERFPSYLP